MSEIGAGKAGLMNIGEEAKPPFAILPDPSSLFETRSKRFAALAPGHQLEPYLAFLSDITRVQHEIQATLPVAPLPSSEAMAQALQHGMPPLAFPALTNDVAIATIRAFLDATVGRVWELRDRKLKHLAPSEVDAVVSANIGCIQHLQSGTRTPVRHWVEVLDEALAGQAPAGPSTPR